MPDDSNLTRVIDRIVILERQAAVKEETMKGIEARLGKIETVLSKLTWLIVGAIFSAALAFIMTGGLRVPLV